MDELQAGVEPTFMVLGQPAVLLQPCKAALDHPALGNHCKRVQLAALGNLHRDMFTQGLAHPLGKGLARVAAVGQHALHRAERALATLECLQSTFAIAHICRGHDNRMRQPLGIDCNVALDARDLLACVVALQTRRVGVLDALRVNNQQRA